MNFERAILFILPFGSAYWGSGYLSLLGYSDIRIDGNDCDNTG
jgi:hypothetical protein